MACDLPQRSHCSSSQQTHVVIELDADESERPHRRLATVVHVDIDLHCRFSKDVTMAKLSTHHVEISGPL